MSKPRIKNLFLLSLLMLSVCLNAITAQADSRAVTPIIVTMLLGDNESKTIKVSWSAPTQLENGESISPADIKSYRVQLQNITDNKTRYTLVDGQLTTVEIDELVTGNYELRIQTVDTNDIQGAYSEPVNFVID